MKTLYLDIFSGISGDMLLGALIDLGVPADRLEQELAKLRLAGYHLHVTRGHKSSIQGVKFEVHVEHEHAHEPGQGEKHSDTHHLGRTHLPTHTHAHSPTALLGQLPNSSQHQPHDHEHSRTFAQIRQLIAESSLSGWVKQKSTAVFHRIAVAEGAIHGLPAEQVHFHEVGAVDSIIDIVGACIALELLGRPRVLAGPVVDGTGWIDCAHGKFPIPAPATLAILGARGVPVTQCEEPHELVTPTGAALLAEFAETFGPMQEVVAEKTGFGLGSRDSKTRPNVLRAILGEATTQAQSPGPAGQTHDWITDTIAVLETNLDDINAEILGNFVERALAAGALDVFHTPIQMKKNRPGVLLTVLCAESDADRFTELMLRETSAFGVRRYTSQRRKLQRELVTVKTQHGEVTVKIGKLDGKVVQAAPEFESCKQLASKSGLPLKQIYEAAVRALGSESRL
jgi:uncharacterized protein (TIGR00299 family) protein